MTTEQFYNYFLSELERIYEKREASNIAEWVFENVTHLKKWEIRRNKDELNDMQRSQLERYLHDLLNHKPVQYVLEEAWFYKMKFFVNENTLIPRPETEELVSWIVNDIKSNYEKGFGDLKILDIGTGTGCIAISIKKELQQCDLTALDISEDSLFVARKNADELKVNIRLIKNDFLDETNWKQLDIYDVIVSNPPYIPLEEKDILSANVNRFEPSIALFVPNEDPFIFYNKIAKFAQTQLESSGKIYVETHEKYAKEISEIFKGYNFETEIRKDIYGKERMIKSRRLTG